MGLEGILKALTGEAEGGETGASEPGPLEPQQYADPVVILKDIEDLVRESSEDRSGEEAGWIEAWRFYRGEHWGHWVNDRIVDDDDQSVPRLVLNYILHVVSVRRGHLLKNRPIIQAMPVRPDEQARNAARASRTAVEGYWYKLKIAKKLARAVLWMLVCGKAFLKVYWDPTAGEMRTVKTGRRPITNEAGEALFDPETGEPAMEDTYETHPEGDLCVEVAFGHEIHVDKGAMDIEHVQRLIHETWIPKAEAQRRWNIPKEELDDIRDDGNDSLARVELEGLSEMSGVKRAGRVRVREAWFRATGDDGNYPEGLYAVEVGGKIREQGPTPNGYDAIPFVEFDEIITNNFWSTSTARQLQDLNRVINIEFSQQEHVRQILRFKTLVPVQGNIDKDALDQRDDEVVEYWHPYLPSHLKPPEVPMSHIELRNSLISVMKELGGSFDVLGGRTQGEVRSGRQTSYLQEYAGTVLGTVAQQIEEGVTRLGQLMLSLMQEKVTEERFVAFVGPNRRAQAVAFKGVDLKGAAIFVQPNSSLPISRTEKWDRVQDWMQRGWLDPKVGLRLLDLGDFDTEIYADEEQDRQNADEIISKLQQVNPELIPAYMEQAKMLAAKEGNLISPRYMLRACGIEAYTFDNHKIHIQQIDRVYRKTDSYRKAPPSIRALADALVEWHLILDDPNHGPLETPLSAVGMVLPPSPPRQPGATGEMGESPPDVGGPPGAPPAAENGMPGSPAALSGGMPPGPGGAGAPPAASRMNEESGSERAEGLPSVPRPPGPNPKG